METDETRQQQTESEDEEPDNENEWNPEDDFHLEWNPLSQQHTPDEFILRLGSLNETNVASLNDEDFVDRMVFDESFMDQMDIPHDVDVF